MLSPSLVAYNVSICAVNPPVFLDCAYGRRPPTSSAPLNTPVRDPLLPFLHANTDREAVLASG